MLKLYPHRYSLTIGMITIGMSAVVGSALYFARGIGVPSLGISPIHCELPRIVPGETAAMKFAIFNRGTAPLTIDQIQTTCGCTSATVDRSSLEPGGEATLSVGFRAPYQPGPFAHQVSFRTDDPKQRTSSVSFAGHAGWPLDLKPTELHWKASDGDVLPPQNLELFGTSGNAFQVNSIQPSTPWIKVVESKDLIEPHRKRYHICIVPGSGIGMRSGTIRIETSEKDRPVLIVPVLCEILPSVRVTPSRLMLKSSKAGSTVLATFVINAKDGSAKVTKVETLAGDWKVIRWEVKTHLPVKALCVRWNFGHPKRTDIRDRASHSIRSPISYSIRPWSRAWSPIEWPYPG